MKHKIVADKQYLFTSKRCSSHDVLISSLYKILEGHERILPCECRKSSNGIAAVQSFSIEKHYEDYGYLCQNHQWEFIHRNNLIDLKEVDTNFHLQCIKCYLIYEIDKQRWTSHPERRELQEESVEFQVSCGGCGHEMEFGWSHPVPYKKNGAKKNLLIENSNFDFFLLYVFSFSWFFPHRGCYNSSWHLKPENRPHGFDFSRKD